MFNNPCSWTESTTTDKIWAYSRMSIRRCPTESPSWKKDLQYPLFKTWELRLRDRKQVTNMKEIRRHINGLKEDGFMWQPYAKMPKKLFQKVPKEDKGLFTSSMVILHYWIVERHNPEHVTKQFGIKQAVPPPFYLPFKRAESLERFEKNYEKCGGEIIGPWEARQINILTGQKDKSKIHSPKYHAWYSSNTIKEIVCVVGGRGK
ncbi:hypothetical protein AAC387_Pa05g1549 [Persea americana]